MNYQEGSGIISDIINLGFPIGLGVVSNMDFNKKDKEKQDGGFISDSLVVEAGLSVVPFSLLGMLELVSEEVKEPKKSK
jgi:hypothetical protein